LHDLEVDVGPGLGGEVDVRVPIVDEGLEQVLLFLVALEVVDEVGHRGEDADHGAASLHEGVGALGRGVAHVLGGVEEPLGVGRAIQRGGGVFDAVEQALREVVRRGEGLGEGELPAVPDADIGQGATVVDVDQGAHATSLCHGESGRQARAGRRRGDYSGRCLRGVRCPKVGQFAGSPWVGCGWHAETAL